MKNIKGIIYLAGVVTDNSSLLKLVEENYPNIYCHHMTVKYGNIGELPNCLGIEFNFIGTAIYKDENAIAVVGFPGNNIIQTMIEQNNQQAHITICTAENIKPVYSNSLIQRARGKNTGMVVPMKFGAFCVFDDNTTGWVFESL